MRAQELNLAFSPSGSDPLYLQVARTISEAIKTGRIGRGMALPGMRELGARWAVSQSTVIAALRELQAQGWIESRPRSGYFVAKILPSPTPRVVPNAATDLPTPSLPGFDLPSGLDPITEHAPAVIDLSDGWADARMAPTAALSRAYHRAFSLKGEELLQGGDARGQRRLCESLSAFLAEQRALRSHPDKVLITRGSVMALSLLAQGLLSPGAHVAVESPGNPTWWDALRQACPVTLHPLPVDEHGVRVDALAELLDRVPLQWVILSPQCHYPTGVALEERRRQQLLTLAQQHRIAIVEMDVEYEFHDLNRLTLKPLAAQDSSGQVIYVGSLSRVLAPGLRLGFIAAPRALIARLAKVSQRLEGQGDKVLQWSVSELILDGGFVRHVRKIRKAALERKQALLHPWLMQVQHTMEVNAELGGMALWLRGAGPLAEEKAFSQWLIRVREAGLHLHPGRKFQLTGEPSATTRLGFTQWTPEEWKELAPRLIQALPSL